MENTNEKMEIKNAVINYLNTQKNCSVFNTDIEINKHILGKTVSITTMKNWFFSKENKKALENILQKYGFEKKISRRDFLVFSKANS